MAQITYFHLRGTGEPIRYVLACQGTKWSEEELLLTDFTHMKKAAGSAAFPFGQAPIFTDDCGLRLPQMPAIVRYLGRKYDMYGKCIVEKSMIDVLMEGSAAFFTHHAKLTGEDNCSPEAVKAYIDLHVEEKSVQGFNGGFHFRFLENQMQRYRDMGLASTEFAVGKKLSIADTHIFWACDFHFERPPFAKVDWAGKFPLLWAHYNAMKKRMSKYMSSEYRTNTMNGSGRG